MKMVVDSDDGIEIETKKPEEYGGSGEIVVLKFHLENSLSLKEEDKEKITGVIEGLKELNPDKFLVEDGEHFIIIAAAEKTEALERLNYLLRQLLNIDRIRARNNNGDGKLYVGNIPYATKESELAELFGRVGKVKKVSVITDGNGQNRGFAFVKMSTSAEANEARKIFNGHQFKERTLKVADAINKLG